MINKSSRNDQFFPGSGDKLFLLPPVLMEGDSSSVLNEIIVYKLLLLYFTFTQKQRNNHQFQHQQQKY